MLWAKVLTIASALLVSPNVSAEPSFCRNALPLTDAEQIWGRSFLAPKVPTHESDRCASDLPLAVSIITGGKHNAAALLWTDKKSDIRYRKLEFSFQIPTDADIEGFTHVAAMVAYEKPSPDIPGSGYGRFGAAIFLDKLYIEYMMDGGNGCPILDSTNTNLFAPVDIPRGGLHQGRWYKVLTTASRSGGGLYVTAILFDVTARGSLRRIVSTHARFPHDCYPAWYGSDRMSFVVGAQGWQKSVVVFIDNVAGESR